MPIFEPRPPRAGAGLPRQIYLPRAAGLGLGGLGMATALFERGGPAWAWAIVVFGALIWPHIAYQCSTRSRMPDRAEKRNLLVDAALATYGVYVIGGNLMPSAIALTIISMNNLSVGGWRLWCQGVGAGLLGVAATSLFMPWHFTPDSSLRVQVACLPVLALYFPAFGWTMLLLARNLHRSREALRRMSLEDALSGVHNRRSFEDTFDAIFRLMRAAPETPGAALLLCDVDHFKQINDAGGHAAGDLVIREMGQVLRMRARRGDLAARYGGDEFVVLLQDAGAAQAIAFAEQLKVDLRLRMALIGGDPAISISTGIACYETAMASSRAWMASADAALYVVKRRQRGGIEVSGR